ncbi:hypothetical protein FLA4_06590 [Candidatus Rickettsia kotlanii]|nr:hypothetical protein FLA4_06590 [Candidatus Rickettsia kotlanii]BDU61492.1 hypothetical protein HM2_06600 [Candidatus Rickettsia kotlanii]
MYIHLLNYSKFLDNNYEGYIKPYLSPIQYPALEKTLSCFEGLAQLLEFQAIILNKQANNLIGVIFQILGSIEKFIDNKPVIQTYRYV